MEPFYSHWTHHRFIDIKGKIEHIPMAHPSSRLPFSLQAEPKKQPKEKPKTQKNPEKEKKETKMHSFGYRANALLTFAVTILALMCAMASVSDNFNHPSPSARVQVPLPFFSLIFFLSF